MVSAGHTLTQQSESQYQVTKGNASEGNGKVSVRMRAVLDMHLAGHTADEIAEALGYAGRQSVYQCLNNDKMRALMQETMDYYDQRFKILYPEVINAVGSALQSQDEKVQLEASKIWLKSHGRLETRKEQTPGTTIENMVANILVQAREANEPRSISDRGSVSDPEQRKTDRRFYTEPESEEVRRPKN